LIEYGVQYPGSDHVSVVSSQSAAQSAVDRAQKFPSTKGAYLVQREVYVTDWVKPD
jgi:hypothetical protein